MIVRLLLRIFRLALLIVEWTAILLAKMVRAAVTFSEETITHSLGKKTEKATAPQLPAQRRAAPKLAASGGWEVITSDKKQGLREERNAETGIRRLVNMRDGSVLVDDLDSLEAEEEATGS